ncbi:hypothetical protein NY607_19315 [Lysinibacillus sp. A4]|uniref:hypothetical protein n=1 Tax=Lysinibacillus sp. A4 TaxID=2976269 RepID=UPI0021761C07|nr:hypothetical protein [Lysinibacillus sp. A4]MCS5503259.1 hypothetical protein [Lysinibacillus sp. A4]
MNKYDEIYNFRQAKLSDQENIMKFIKLHWRENHILGNDETFFKFEHGDGDKINFIICEDKKSNEITGIHGFIPYSFNKRNSHYCGVMTMVRKDVAIPLLGVELIKRFIQITKYNTYCGIGTNPKTMVPLVKRVFRRFTGTMSHYYKLNPNNYDFKIAKIVQKSCIVTDCKTDSVEFIEISSFTELKNTFELNLEYRFLPFKEDWYLKKRYFDHPVYNYRVFVLTGTNKAIIIAREININNSKILRFVDFIGDIKMLSKIDNFTDELLINENYEYIDFLVGGLPTNYLVESGFTLKDEHTQNIIPNYFEPFIQQNVEIWYEVSHENMIVFKGDADADRPNFYRERD